MSASRVTNTNPAPASLEGFGLNQFRGAVAAKYLAQQGLPVSTLSNAEWTRNGKADKVSSQCDKFSYIFYAKHCVIAEGLLMLIDLVEQPTF